MLRVVSDEGEGVLFRICFRRGVQMLGGILTSFCGEKPSFAAEPDSAERGRSVLPVKVLRSYIGDDGVGHGLASSLLVLNA